MNVETKQKRAQARIAAQVERSTDWPTKTKQSVARRIEAMIATGATATLKIADACGATAASIDSYRVTRDAQLLVRDVERAAWNSALKTKRR